MRVLCDPAIILISAWCCCQLGWQVLAARVQHDDVGKGPTLPPVPKEERFAIKRLPIEFLVDEEAAVLQEETPEGGAHWFCVKIRLLPEDGGDKYAVFARRLGDQSPNSKPRYRVSLVPEAEGESDGQPSIDGESFLMDVQDVSFTKEPTPYARDPSMFNFIAKHMDEDQFCHKQAGVYVRFSDLQAFVHERLTKSTGEVDIVPDDEKDILERHIEKWNKEWARPVRAGGNTKGCKTRRECSGFHVTYFKLPPGLQAKIDARLSEHWSEFYETHGAGIAGTTGAHFVAGNRGYRFPDFGGEKLQLLFPSSEEMKEFEEALADVVRQRPDVREKFGDRPEVDYQHRLWRYGPDFSVKGGIWHRDTCPFGIGGGVPQGGWQLTSVYVLYADNMDLSQSGTRLKDRFGKTHDMPCLPGTANIMRSGENDPLSPWHAGPVLKKVNKSRPAYRVMMQSKMLFKPSKKRYTAGAERWGALGISALPQVANVPDAQKKALIGWFANLSQALAWGASESNAVGSEAYPINAQRAWARTEEMAHFLGFQGGFLPHFGAPPVDVEDENLVTPSQKEPKDATVPDDG